MTKHKCSLCSNLAVTKLPAVYAQMEFYTENGDDKTEPRACKHCKDVCTVFYNLLRLTDNTKYDKKAFNKLI